MLAASVFALKRNCITYYEQLTLTLPTSLPFVSFHQYFRDIVIQEQHKVVGLQLFF